MVETARATWIPGETGRSRTLRQTHHRGIEGEGTGEGDRASERETRRTRVQSEIVDEWLRCDVVVPDIRRRYRRMVRWVGVILTTCWHCRHYHTYFGDCRYKHPIPMSGGSEPCCKFEERFGWAKRSWVQHPKNGRDAGGFSSSSSQSPSSRDGSSSIRGGYDSRVHIVRTCRCSWGIHTDPCVENGSCNVTMTVDYYNASQTAVDWFWDTFSPHPIPDIVFDIESLTDALRSSQTISSKSTESLLYAFTLISYIFRIFII